MNHSPMSFESVGLSLNRQIRAVKAVDTPLVSTEEYRYRRLCRYSLVLGEERPSALQPILNPFRITDLLGVISEVFADCVDDPAPLNQNCRRAFAEATVCEELRRRLG
jgi:hypothetical protein